MEAQNQKLHRRPLQIEDLMVTSDRIDRRFRQAIQILGPEATVADYSEWVAAQLYLETKSHDPELAEQGLALSRLSGTYRRSTPLEGPLVPLPPETPVLKPAPSDRDLRMFSDPAAARRYLESQRWPEGVCCPHCGLVGESSEVRAKSGSKHPARQGLWKCRSCQKQFTVTVGTIFAGSRVPLHLWLRAIHRMSNCRPTTAAHLKRTLNVTYDTACHIRDRIQRAMQQEPLRSVLREFARKAVWDLKRPWPRPETGKPNRYPRRLSFPLSFTEVMTLLLRIRTTTTDVPPVT